MADDRKKAAIKGWQTRHARQRMLKDAQELADARLSAHLQGAQNQATYNWGQAQQSNAAQDYANASRAQNNNMTQRGYTAAPTAIFQPNEKPAARKKRLAKLKAWWRWFYHGE